MIVLKANFSIGHLQWGNQGINESGSGWLSILIKIRSNQVKRLAHTISSWRNFLVTIPKKTKKERKKKKTNFYNKQNSNITLYRTFIFKGSQNAYKPLFKSCTGTTEAQPHFGARRGAEMSIGEDIPALKGVWSA